MMSSDHIQELNFLFPVEFDAELAQILSEGMDLLSDYPEIRQRIISDMDDYSRAEKEKRLANEQWERDHRQLELINVPDNDSQPVTRSPMELATGRPRLKPELVYLFFICRGYYGGLYTKDNWSRIYDSITFRSFAERSLPQRYPSPTAISEHLNHISNDTRECIMQCQLAKVTGLKLDDFQTLAIDSTHIHSRSAWPVDTTLILKSLNRAYNLGQHMHNHDLDDFKPWHCPRWLKDLDTLEFQINMSKGRKRRRLSRKFLEKARKMENRLSSLWDDMDEIVSNHDLLPSKKVQLERHWNLLIDSLTEASILNDVAWRRLVDGEKVEREDFEKIFSTSDRSAAFIEKGGREKVFGYRVQFGRSRNGLVTSVIVPEGNAADSTMLVPMTDEHIKKTTVIPESVTTDDGYSSGKGRTILLKRGVKNVSINGSKGKKITPVEEWESELFNELRSHRSAVESLMFTGKFKFNFGQFSRCGIEAVRAEMLEKVIAHNFWRIAHEKARQKPKLAAAS
jgi:hypothetical protein